GDVEVSEEKTHDIQTSPASISPQFMVADQVITSQDALLDLFQWYTLHGGPRSRKVWSEATIPPSNLISKPRPKPAMFPNKDFIVALH
nr:hypothetical protein [Tanacetum cinerariifolium]